MKSIFVSSTFKDMQHERDLINNYIWPRLNELANKYKKSIYFTDLRWGVNTENLDSDEGSKKVLEVCFDEITRSNPYMLIFIGERYGWIPEQNIIDETVSKYNIQNKEEKSVTELEIQFGALSQKDLSNCIFCFRNELDKTNLPEELKKNYSSEDEKHKQKLERLKQEILDRNPNHVIYYDGKFNENGNLELSSNLAKEIEEILENKMKEEWGNLAEKSWQEKELENALFFIENQNNNFVGREELIKQYVDHINNEQNQSFILLEGESGSGRTSIICKLYEELAKNTNYDIYPFLVGLSEKSRTFLDMFNQVNYFLAQKIGIEKFDANTKDFLEAKENHMELMFRYKQKFSKKLIILIDGIEQALFDEETKDFEWYLKLNNEILFVTQTPEFSQPDKNRNNPILRNDKISYLTVPKLKNEEKIDIINSICYINNKQLSENIKQEICNMDKSDNPLYLQMVLQRLIKMSKNDFNEIRKNGDNMSAINKVQLELISKMPNNLPELERMFLDYSSEIIETEGGREALNLVIASICQLTRKDIEKILKQNNYEWNDLKFSSLLRYLQMFIFEDNNGEIIFMHYHSINKILNENEYKKYYTMIFNYLKTLEAHNLLKCSNFCRFAYLSGQGSEILEYARELYNNNDIEYMQLLCAEIYAIVENQKFDINFIPELLKNINEEYDKKFLKAFFIKEILKTLLAEDKMSYSILAAQQFVNVLSEKLSTVETQEGQIEKMDIMQQLSFFMGKIYYIFKEYSKAYTMFIKSMQLLNLLNLGEEEDLKRNIEIFSYIQDLLYIYAEREESEKYAFANVKCAERLVELNSNESNLILLINAYKNLASKTNDILYYSKALDIIKKVLELPELEQSDSIYKDGKINIQFNIGMILIENNNFEEAEKILLTTLQDCFSNETNTVHGYHIYRELIKLYIKQSKIDLAKKMREDCFDELDLMIFKYPKNTDKYKEFKKNIDIDLIEYLDSEEVCGVTNYIVEKASSDDKTIELEAYKDFAKIFSKLKEYKFLLDNLELEYGVYLELNDYDRYGEDMVMTLGRIAELYTQFGQEEKAKKYLIESFNILSKKIKIDKLFLVEVAYSTTRTLGKILFKEKKYGEYYVVQKFEYKYLHDFYLHNKENTNIKNKLMVNITDNFLVFTEKVTEDYKLLEEVVNTAIDIHSSFFEANNNFNEGLMSLCDTFENAEKKLGTEEKIKQKYMELLKYFETSYGEKANSVILKLIERIEKFC